MGSGGEIRVDMYRVRSYSIESSSNIGHENYKSEDLVLFDAYTKVKFSSTRNILHNAVHGIINVLYSFILL